VMESSLKNNLQSFYIEMRKKNCRPSLHFPMHVLHVYIKMSKDRKYGNIYTVIRKAFQNERKR